MMFWRRKKTPPPKPQAAYPPDYRDMHPTLGIPMELYQSDMVAETLQHFPSIYNAMIELYDEVKRVHDADVRSLVRLFYEDKENQHRD